jgi:integrase
MASKKLTDTVVRNARPSITRYELTDGKSVGLVLRVTPRGIKTWAVRFYLRSRQQRFTLGKYPAMSLASAREQAARITSGVQRGEDPGGKKVVGTPVGNETVADLVTSWRELHALVKNRPATIASYEGIAKSIILPAIGSMPVRSVTTRDLALVLSTEATRLLAKGKRGTQANRTKAVLTKIFKLACQWGWIKANPASNLSSPVSEKPRERFLTIEEIEQIWLFLDREPLWFATALRLLLVTGQRPGELITARWADFDLHQGIWTISENKAGNLHAVPLSALARSILSFKSTQNESSSVFPDKQDRSIKRATFSQATRRFCAKSKLQPFTPHDLRRTVTTHMRRIGIAPYIVDRVQNRVETSVQARHYDRWTYLPEKTKALTMWASEIERLAIPVMMNAAE